MVSATYEWLTFRRRDGVRLAALVLAAGAVGLGLPADAVAQAKKAAEATAAAEPPRIQRAYAAGVRAFESGDMAEADRQLSTALSGGGLPNAQMAKALYLRGTAYRQLGRPAQAISDLTTAVWLKGGLSETDKAKATQERQLAYREAGLGDSPPPVGAAPLDQSPTTATAASPAPTPGTQVVNVGKGGFWNNVSMPSLPSLPSLSFGSSQTQTAAATPDAAATSDASAAVVPVQGFAPAAEGAPAEAASAFGAVTVAAPEAAAGQQASVEQVVAAGQSSSWDTQTSADAAVPSAQLVSTGYAPLQEAAGLAAVPGTAPAAAAPQAGGSASSGWSNPLAGSGTAISGFFGNIFGGGAGAQTASADVAGVTTGSTNPAAGWGPETTVATAQTSSMVQRGPDAPVAAAPMAAAPMAVAPMAAPAAAAPMAAEAPTALPWTAAPGAPAQQAAAPQAAPQQAATRMASTGPAAGRYKLQVASVRSREEAERLAETLRGYQPVRDGTVAPEVDEAVIGSMGTFYRVRLGPYANASEPGQLCKTLKPQGFDCLVVTQ